ncbi:MAG: GNAT family N-acetyltransferase [Phycisphaeraceae bacterium]|nr:GNAT family N-acetyltransferase [Phycisphaeraceae bacterium]
MVRIRNITRADPLYVQECALREKVLLRDVGLTIESFQNLFPGVEERFEHFVAVFDHPSGERVIGCALLLPHFPESGVGKLMQMVVDPQRQNEGIGRKLVVAVESRAFGELGLREIFCHARDVAYGFYERLGWEYDSDVFMEADSPHRRMVIRNPEPAPI